MVSESVGTVMCVRRRWHAGFHSNVFMKVLEWRKWGRKVGEGGWEGSEKCGEVLWVLGGALPYLCHYTLVLEWRKLRTANIT